MHAFFSLFCFCFCLMQSFPLFSNDSTSPFYLEKVPEEVLSDEGALALQDQLRQISITEKLRCLYPTTGTWAAFQDFHNRLSVAANAKIVADAPLANGRRTEQIFRKIGKGGDRCVVTYATFNEDYANTARKIPGALKKTGFNGYFFAFLGGYPNPTGQELGFAATPYAFKIFMMKEAQKKGFNHLLWIDCRCIPLKSIKPIFKQIEAKGSFFMGGLAASRDEKYLLPETKLVIEQELGINPLESRKIIGTVFGLKMNSPDAEKFVELYYGLVKKGSPFFSCYPEEFVISSILKHLGTEKFFFSLDNPRFSKLVQSDRKLARKERAFFYHAPRSYGKKANSKTRARHAKHSL